MKDNSPAVLDLGAVDHNVRPVHLLGATDPVRLDVETGRSARVVGAILTPVGLVASSVGIGLLVTAFGGDLGSGCKPPICLSNNDWGKFFGTILTAVGGASLLSGVILLGVDANTAYPAETSQVHPLLSERQRSVVLRLAPVAGPDRSGVMLSGRF